MEEPTVEEMLQVAKELREEISGLRSEISAKDGEISELLTQISAKDARISELAREHLSLVESIGGLLDVLENIISSVEPPALRAIHGKFLAGARLMYEEIRVADPNVPKEESA